MEEGHHHEDLYDPSHLKLVNQRIWSITAHPNAYKGIIFQLSCYGMMIDKRLCAFILMSRVPPSWETFISMVCNASTPNITYASGFTMGSIMSDDIWRKLFVEMASSEAYVVQDTGDRQSSWSHSSSRAWATQRAEESLGICEHVITSRCPDISRLNVMPSIPKFIKLRGLNTRVVVSRRRAFVVQPQHLEALRRTWTSWL